MSEKKVRKCPKCNIRLVHTASTLLSGDDKYECLECGYEEDFNEKQLEG